MGSPHPSHAHSNGAEGSEFEAYYDDPNAFDTATTDSRIRFNNSVQVAARNRVQPWVAVCHHVQPCVTVCNRV